MVDLASTFLALLSKYQVLWGVLLLLKFYFFFFHEFQTILCLLPALLWWDFSLFSTTVHIELGFFLLQSRQLGCYALAELAFTTYFTGTPALSMLCHHTIYITSSRKPEKVDGVPLEAFFFVLQVGVNLLQNYCCKILTLIMLKNLSCIIRCRSYVC